MKDLGPDPWNGEFDLPRPRLLGTPLLKVGQVVVSEGDEGIISRGIQRMTDSIWTHAFVVTGEDELTEAWMPRCRRFSVAERLEELQKNARRYVVLDYPNFLPHQRAKVAEVAVSFVGRRYDVRDVLHFAWKGRFHIDGGSGMFCSRLVCEAFWDAGVLLYPPDTLARLEARGHPRVEQLRRGYPTPEDLFDSTLVTTHQERAA